jgi:hypothetical protein
MEGTSVKRKDRDIREHEAREKVASENKAGAFCETEDDRGADRVEGAGE